MRKVTQFAIVGLMALSITGCQFWPWSGTQEERDAKVTAIIELVKEGCKFEVERNSVVAMLAAANPVFTGAGALADAICNAVNKSVTEEATKAAPMEGASCQFGEVNGVCIQGKKIN